MKKIGIIMLVWCVVAAGNTAQAQSILKRAAESAKKATERNVERKTEKAVDKAFDKAEEAVTGQGNNQSPQQTAEPQMMQSQSGGEVSAETQPAAQPIEQSLEMIYAKSDFVPGDEVIFEDNFVGERLGEFPSQWELHRGNAEIAQINGENVLLMMGKDSWLEPLMKTPKNYLGDVFTVEFDFLMPPYTESNGSFELDFMEPTAGRDQDVFSITWGWRRKPFQVDWRWKNSNGNANGQAVVARTDNKWYHMAVSFNKRALKVYVDGVRIANVPNVVAPPGWVTFWTGYSNEDYSRYIKNVRIAKGAVPLYDRMLTDGKFITYGITFDVGKSTIKPESMGEINRIVTLMTENPDLNFSVEGHTDSTGNAASNQTLSKARSEAIVDKLVELGISPERLSSAGKGQENPIADNGTDEGRAKNRRVEFVKI